MTLFHRIEDNLDKSQFQTAVLIYRFLEEKSIPSKLDIPEFSEIYQRFKRSAVERISSGVDNMLDTWLNYCSSKQKEISEKCYKKIDSVIKTLYSANSKAISRITSPGKKAALARNIRMSYMNGSIAQRESLTASNLLRPSLMESSGIHDLSRGSNIGGGGGGNQQDGSDGQAFLPGTKVDLHILSNVVNFD